MDIISLLATVILVTTIGTLVVAVAAYAAFKLRDRRKPTRKDPTIDASGALTPVFIARYRPKPEGGSEKTEAGSRENESA